MTDSAPTEPLKLTLEEAMREAHFVRLEELREKHGNLADVQVAVTEDGWWVFLNDDGKWNNTKEFGIGEWEAAFSYALGREVVSRDEAAELRAAAIEWWQAMRDYRYVPTADQEAQNQRLLAAENRLAGAVKDLAATGGGGGEA